jgi:hypothetical protein
MRSPIERQAYLRRYFSTNLRIHSLTENGADVACSFLPRVYEYKGSIHSAERTLRRRHQFGTRWPKVQPATHRNGRNV